VRIAFDVERSHTHTVTRLCSSRGHRRQRGRRRIPAAGNGA